MPLARQSIRDGWVRCFALAVLLVLTNQDIDVLACLTTPALIGDSSRFHVGEMAVEFPLALCVARRLPQLGIVETPQLLQSLVQEVGGCEATDIGAFWLLLDARTSVLAQELNSLLGAGLDEG